MTSECNFKNELCGTNESCYKFFERDLEIKRTCYHCRTDIDRNFCKLSKIYEQKTLHMELNELLEEINNRKKEVTYLETQKEKKQQEVKDLNKEIGILSKETTKIRTNDFLRATIGGENYLFYLINGHFDVIGTDGSVYRITSKGKVSKIEVKKGRINRIKNFIAALAAFLKDYRQEREIERWEGRIGTSNYPLEDSIAIVYINIMKNSDRFDIDKACGNIYMRSI